MVSTASYDTFIPKLGGKMMDGFYTMSASNIPYPDDPSKNRARLELQLPYKTSSARTPRSSRPYGWTVMSALPEGPADLQGRT